MRKMGGLAKYTPITRWTYLAACWAIAGFPWAAGFYSKDEILWKAWTADGLAAPWVGQAIYLIGAVAALGTSFYMFRSYYMTFTGEYRGGHGHEPKETLEDPEAMAAHAHATAAIAAHDEHDAEVQALAASVPHPHAHVAEAHEHGGLPRESPRTMTWVLVALAAAAVVSGIVFGFPQLWSGGHEPLLEKFLAPSLPAAESVPFRETSHATELLFQLIGFGIAAVGWVVARALYLDAKSTVPERLKEAFPRAWAVVYNKYYVDELYEATVVRFARFCSRALYWFDQNVIDGIVNLMATIGKAVAYVDAAFDQKVVDGAVNLLADAFLYGGAKLRRLQTGHIQAYLFGALAGAIAFVIIQYVIR
jgi:NADH-quinone oxidoreductase subunit L